MEAFLIVIAMVSTIVFVIVVMELSMMEGPLFHAGWEMYNPAVQALCADMLENPDDYAQEEYSFRSEKRGISIYTSLGKSHYKDAGTIFSSGAKNKIGTFSFFDRILLKKTLSQWNLLKGYDTASKIFGE